MADDEQVFMLTESGSRAWNRWRARNTSVDIDLTGANLRGADLRHANLANTNLAEAELVQAICAGPICRRPIFPRPMRPTLICGPQPCAARR